MTEITDEYMKERLSQARPYTVVILKKTPTFKMPDVYPIIWEHGRKNMVLQADGLLQVVCPINDETEVCGISVFGLEIEEVKRIMEEDPAMKAGILTYEIHPARGFPGSCLK